MSRLSMPQVDAPAPARRLAIKIDVDTLRGAQQGVPALIELLQRHEAGATFLFALGPDQTGRSFSRMIGSGRTRGCQAPSSIERVGLTGVFHGTLLPAPVLGERAEPIIRATADAGFEVGVRPWNPHAWQRRAARADAAWTLEQMQLAHDRFVNIFGKPPRIHGASGWQMSRHAFRLTQRLGFDYCSDTRGFRPYIPVLDAEIIACPQLPTTLPTFDELLADAGYDRTTVHERMLHAIAGPAPDGHVLNLNADSDGIPLLSVVERLLEGLRARSVVLLSLEAYIAAVGTSSLPRHRVDTVRPQGSMSDMSMQFKEFLA